MKAGYRPGGARIKRPDAAALGRPKKIMITGHGASSRALMRDSLDMRTRVGQAYRAHQGELIAHLGGREAVTVPQLALIDQAVRLHLLGKIAWAELQRAGAFNAGELSQAFEAYLRASASERVVLDALGLERKAKQVPTLHDHLSRPPAQPAPALEHSEERPV